MSTGGSEGREMNERDDGSRVYDVLVMLVYS